MYPRVLVVEEQPALRERYAEFLHDEGYDVVTTSAVDEVLSLARKLEPRVVVLDPDAGSGRGMQAALDLLELNLSLYLVFNTSHPFSMETDFSTWVADAYAVRSHGVRELSQTLRHLLAKEQALSAPGA